MSSGLVIFFIIFLELILAALVVYTYIRYCHVLERPLGSGLLYKVIIVGLLGSHLADVLPVRGLPAAGLRVPEPRHQHQLPSFLEFELLHLVLGDHPGDPLGALLVSRR